MGFRIRGEKFDVIVGYIPKTDVVERYVFDGWTNEDQKKKFFGSFDFLEAEAIAGRTDPSLRNSGVYIIKVIPPKNSVPSYETLVGSILEVNYGKQYCDTAFFEDFFVKSHVAVHRADPFVMPIKTLWQFIKEKFSRK